MENGKLGQQKQCLLLEPKRLTSHASEMFSTSKPAEHRRSQKLLLQDRGFIKCCHFYQTSQKKKMI